MGQTPSEIEAYIDHTRSHLSADLEELEQKVKSATDWRQHFRRNSVAMLGAAFGGGIALALALNGRKNRGVSQSEPARYRQTGFKLGAEALETWGLIKGAMLGVATTHVTNYIGEFIPGFSDHLHRARTAKQAAEPQ